MSQTLDAVHKMLLTTDMNEVCETSFLDGKLAYFTHRSPDKETVNEDAIGIFSVSDSQGVLVVADGCGGMQGGEIAAETVVREIQRKLSKWNPQDSLRGAVLDGLELANEAILALGKGSATTVVVAILEDRKVRTIHAGDSQVLLVGGRGKLKLQTVSHSPVGYGVEAGLIDEDQAIEHEDRHIVSNIVGAESTHFEIGSRRPMAQRDTLLLGSDGVFDNFLEEELTRLTRIGTVEHAAEEIISTARYRMVHEEPDVPSKADDISLLLFRR